MNTDVIKRYAELAEMKVAREADLDEVKKEMESLKEIVLNELVSAGVKSMKVTLLNGRERTVYARKVKYAAVKYAELRPQLVKALRETGHEDLITVNSNRFSSWAREMMEEGGPGIPHAVEQCIEMRERVEVRAPR